MSSNWIRWHPVDPYSSSFWICTLGFFSKGKLWWISVTLGSRNHGDKNPVWFTLGIREVLRGWDRGLQNMCAGERRKLTIPPALAYGKEGKGTNTWVVNLNEEMLICCIILAHLSSVLFFIAYLWVFLCLQVKSLLAVPSFLTLSSWRSKTVPGHTSLSGRWI